MINNMREAYRNKKQTETLQSVVHSITDGNVEQEYKFAVCSNRPEFFIVIDKIKGEVNALPKDLLFKMPEVNKVVKDLVTDKYYNWIWIASFYRSGVIRPQRLPLGEVLNRFEYHYMYDSFSAAVDGIYRLLSETKSMGKARIRQLQESVDKVCFAHDVLGSIVRERKMREGNNEQ